MNPDNNLSNFMNNIVKPIKKKSNIPKKYELSKKDGIVEIKEKEKAPYKINEDSKIEPIH